MTSLATSDSSLSSGLGGLFFAEPMRNRKFVTMMDGFQIKYGDTITGLLSVAPLMSEVIWVTSTLISLGEKHVCVPGIQLPSILCCTIPY